VGFDSAIVRGQAFFMKHPMAVLIGAVLIWIVTISTLFNQPIVWWRTIIMAVAAVFVTGTYIRERAKLSP
jgi:hypothetical protein